MLHYVPNNKVTETSNLVTEVLELSYLIKAKSAGIYLVIAPITLKAARKHVPSGLPTPHILLDKRGLAYVGTPANVFTALLHLTWRCGKGGLNPPEDHSRNCRRNSVLRIITPY